MSRGARLLAWAAILALVAVAWWGATSAPFVYDDRVEVARNATIRAVGNWRAVFGYNASRALLILTYAFDHAVWGTDARGRLDPAGFHRTSLALHALAVGAALAMADAVGRLGRHPAAGGVAALAVAAWAVHPMQTEAVTYITGRSEVLCGLFVFLGLWAWARALLAERAGRRGTGFRLLGVAAYAAAVLSKEVGAMLPLAMLALELLPGGGARRVRWRWMLLFAVIVAGAAWLRYDRLGTLAHREVDRDLGVQLVTAARVWLRYVGLWFAPVGQTLFHHQPDLAPLSARGLAAVGGWLAAVAVAVAWGRRVPLAGWALLAAGLFLLPSTSVVPLKENMAEHRAWQTGLYLFLAVGWSVPAGWRRRVAVAVVALLPVLVWATRRRNAVWSSEVALWEEATARNPEVAAAWYGLGDALRFSGRFEEAQAAYLRATELDPDDLEAWNNLGIARAELGDAEGARAAWKEALRRRPSYCKAHNNLGSLALRRKELDLAIAELKSTLAWCPDDVLAHYMLGNIYYGPRRDPEKARLHYEAVVALDPDFSELPTVKERLLELTW